MLSSSFQTYRLLLGCDGGSVIPPDLCQQAELLVQVFHFRQQCFPDLPSNLSHTMHIRSTREASRLRQCLQFMAVFMGLYTASLNRSHSHAYVLTYSLQLPPHPITHTHKHKHGLVQSQSTSSRSDGGIHSWIVSHTDFEGSSKSFPSPSPSCPMSMVTTTAAAAPLLAPQQHHQH